MNQKLLSLLGLKWNPFTPDIPVEALWRHHHLDHFCWRLETLVEEGGFALIPALVALRGPLPLPASEEDLAALPELGQEHRLDGRRDLRGRP